MMLSPADHLRLSDCQCASERAERLLELLQEVSGVLGCYIADLDGTPGFECLPGLLRQTPHFASAQLALKDLLHEHYAGDGSTVRTTVEGGELLFRRVNEVFLCALVRTGSCTRTAAQALRAVAENLPGGLKLAPSIPPAAPVFSSESARCALAE